MNKNSMSEWLIFQELKNKSRYLRNPFLDRLKFILIILVVIGHVGFIRTSFVDVRIVGTMSDTMKELVRIIYLFHMPVFVFVSGYLTTTRSFKETFSKSTKFIKLFLVFHCFNIFISTLITCKLPSLKDFLYPSFGLWYLLALFFWRIIFASLGKDYNKKVVVLFCIFLSCISIYLPIPSFLGLNRCISFLPFFAIGIVLRKSNFVFPNFNCADFFRAKPMFWGGVFSMVLSIFIIACFEIPPFYGIERGGLTIRIVHLLVASVLGTSVIFLCSFLPKGEFFLSYGGKNSLFVYLYHPYFMLLLSFLFIQFEEDINLGCGLIISFIAVFVLLILTKNHSLNKIIS